MRKHDFITKLQIFTLNDQYFPSYVQNYLNYVIKINKVAILHVSSTQTKCKTGKCCTVVSRIKRLFKPTGCPTARACNRTRLA